MKNIIYGFTLLIFVSIITGCFFPSAGPDLTSEQITNINSALDILDSGSEAEEILNDLNMIRNVLYPEAMAIAENSLIDRFTALGFVPKLQPVILDSLRARGEYVDFELDFSGPFTMNNIIAVKTGTNPELAPVLITGHWDSVYMGPGIDDNATSCAGVLEAARALQGFTFERTIKFILYAFEEEGLIGSYYYIKNMSEAERPKSVINLEMIGYTQEEQELIPLTDVLIGFPSKGDFLAVFATDFSHELGVSYVSALNQFVPDLPYYFARTGAGFPDDPFLTDILRSDHTPFWEIGIPALMVTDTANMRNSNYHTSHDTIDTIDFDFLIDSIRSGTAALCIEAGIK